MKNVVLYCRVSTDEQARLGTSLTYQETRLTDFCAKKNLTIEKIFKEDFSGKTFDRPEWKALEEFIRKNKQVDGILVLVWDRLARNMREAINNIFEFRERGIEINAIDRWYDFSSPHVLLSFVIDMAIPEYYNAILSQRVKDGMRGAKSEGRYVGRAPLGYQNARTSNGKSFIEPNDKADIVKSIFMEFSNGQYTVEEFYRIISKEKKIRISRIAFRSLLSNIIYIGKVLVKGHDAIPDKIVQGLHQPIVDEFTFYKVQDIINGRKRKYYIKDNLLQEQFPLRGHLVCHQCHHDLTGSSSKGNGGYYSYYHCIVPCKERFRADEAHNGFLHYLRSIKPAAEVLKAYELIVRDTIKENTDFAGENKKELKKKITEYQQKLDNLDEKLIENVIAPDRYKINRDRILNDISSFKAQLLEMEKFDTDISKSLDFGINLLSNLDCFYEKATGRQKKRIIGSLFPEKLVYKNKSFRTNGNNELIALLEGNLNLVGITGFEPVTSRV